jgi:hypothetical protein
LRGVVGHSMVEFGDSVIGIGTQGAHGAFSPKTAGTASHYISVYIDDIDAHYQRALAAGAQIASALYAHRTDYRAYEALDLEGHRWRFVQWRPRYRSTDIRDAIDAQLARGRDVRIRTTSRSARQGSPVAIAGGRGTSAATKGDESVACRRAHISGRAPRTTSGAASLIPG